jgi:hypothetical protein
MNTAKLQTLPAPPNLIKALLAGFDCVGSHLSLALFTVVLDAVLWFGPRVQLTALVEQTFDRLGTVLGSQAGETADALQFSRDLWLQFASNYNLLDTLRSYPIGIPSLVASRVVLANPLNAGEPWQLSSFLVFIVAWVLLTLLGLLAATFYFSVVGQAALAKKINLSQVIRELPGNTLQFFYLALAWLVILLIVSVPFGCLLTFLLASGMGVSQVMVLIYAGVLIWLSLPLLFVPLIIVVEHAKIQDALRQSARLVRATLPTTSLFILVAVLISQGLKILWNIPEDGSWLLLVGIAGHAFITASLLAAGFIYYHDARRWMAEVMQRAKQTV